MSVTAVRIRPFNTPLECGLRLLFTLDAARGCPLDLQRLVAYDYLLVHSGDVEMGPTSLHPAVPFRGGELLVKRDLVQAGLNVMFARELLTKRFEPSGIWYRSNDLTAPFLRLLVSPYASALRSRAEWVTNHFASFTDDLLENYMTQSIGRWGAEFERLTAIRELEL
ncbi:MULTISPECIES: ABC-three component system middle component 2 [unclassified Beijerinckia]|uniref:ABC-three component system middle component 2 n=1 Tax=unclassified Beijerinckia TaxID=2638183 RepID=UPI000894C404|nr:MULTISPECIES: ABC-three component system middle component 2 [unclassified Beijerinckia]MDH7794608.1 hypothetical protein [Beijerinckia sp. GAS462]SEB68360.1 hypothetical protein SAMN05443249_0880 [Beijerinckia sp. 28-YEA-48]